MGLTSWLHRVFTHARPPAGAGGPVEWVFAPNEPPAATHRSARSTGRAARATTSATPVVALQPPGAVVEATEDQSQAPSPALLLLQLPSSPGSGPAPTTASPGAATATCGSGGSRSSTRPTSPRAAGAALTPTGVHHLQLQPHHGDAYSTPISTPTLSYAHPVARPDPCLPHPQEGHTGAAQAMGLSRTPSSHRSSRASSASLRHQQAWPQTQQQPRRPLGPAGPAAAWAVWAAGSSVGAAGDEPTPEQRTRRVQSAMQAYTRCAEDYIVRAQAAQQELQAQLQHGPRVTLPQAVEVMEDGIVQDSMRTAQMSAVLPPLAQQQQGWHGRPATAPASIPSPGACTRAVSSSRRAMAAAAAAQHSFGGRSWAAEASRLQSTETQLRACMQQLQEQRRQVLLAQQQGGLGRPGSAGGAGAAWRAADLESAVVQASLRALQGRPMSVPEAGSAPWL